MDDYFRQSLAKLEWFEGSIPWMYQDAAGRVTVGVGVGVTDAVAARALPFQLKGRPATGEEIGAEFVRVEALPMGRPAHFYREPDGPELEKADIDALLREVLLRCEGEIKAGLKGYDHLPYGVKMALLDLGYDLGPAGLLGGHPALIRAVEEGEWKRAAAASFRPGPGAGRNRWTEEMLLGTLGEMRSEGVLRRFCYGLVGAGATFVGWVKRRKDRSALRRANW